MSIASVLEALRREYEPSLRDEAKALAAALAADDFVAARRIAHRVGGTAGSYGFAEASSAARAIQNAIETNETAAIAAALTELQRAVGNA